MNSAGRILLNFTRSSKHLLTPNKICLAGQIQTSQVHNYVRRVRYCLRKKRMVEADQFPERVKQLERRSGFSDWNYRAELYAFGRRLGENFKEPLLLQAFVDKSYIQAAKKRQEELGLDPETITFKDNTELAEIGRQLLVNTLTSFISQEFPKIPKQGIEYIVDQLTSPQSLENISSLLGTKDLIQCSEYPPNQNHFATAFEALVGALEQSSGKEKAEKFVVDFVASQLCGKDIHDFWDIPKPWHLLLEMTKPQGKTLEPRLLRETGRNTLLSSFVVGIYDQDKKLLGTGIGETVDIAQEMAARDVLRNLFGTTMPRPPFQFQSQNFPLQLIPHVRNP